MIAAALLFQFIPVTQWILHAGSPAAVQPISIASPQNPGISNANAAISSAELDLKTGMPFGYTPVRFGAASSTLSPVTPAISSSLPAIRTSAPPAPPVFAISPPITPLHPGPDHKKLWLALMITQHSAAGFDAWTTRRLISSGDGRELNPVLRPFADNVSLYAAIQAGPFLFDYLGRRMMESHNRMERRTWWIPAAAGTVISIFCGVHNMQIYSPASPNPGF